MMVTEDRKEGPREQSQDGIPAAGSQAGGGPQSSDMGAPGGSSGEGGYGRGQNQAFHQGQQGGSDRSDGLSREERLDEAQGGGRGPGSVSPDEDDRERAAHQDRGQSIAAEESDADG